MDAMNDGAFAMPAGRPHGKTSLAVINETDMRLGRAVREFVARQAFVLRALAMEPRGAEAAAARHLPAFLRDLAGAIDPIHSATANGLHQCAAGAENLALAHEAPAEENACLEGEIDSLEVALAEVEEKSDRLEQQISTLNNKISDLERALATKDSP